MALTGLLLAVVGLYGAVAHMIAMRRREIGIRMALGAMQSQIVRMTLTHGGMVIASGLVAGTAGAILIASAVAAVLPAWRAARIETSVALRHE